MNDTDQGNTWFDGTKVTTNGSGASNTAYQPKRIQFGGYYSSSEFSKCQVAEFLVYDRVLEEEERMRVESYLAHKWGHEAWLDDDHPYKTSSPFPTDNALVIPVIAIPQTYAYPVPFTVTFRKDGNVTAVTGRDDPARFPASSCQ